MERGGGGSDPVQGDDLGDEGGQGGKEDDEAPRDIEDSGGDDNVPPARSPIVTDAQHPAGHRPLLHACATHPGQGSCGPLRPQASSHFSTPSVPDSGLPAHQPCQPQGSPLASLFPSAHLATSCTSCSSRPCCLPLKEAFQTRSPVIYPWRNSGPLSSLCHCH